MYDITCAYWMRITGSSWDLDSYLKSGWEPFQVDPADEEGDCLVWLRRRIHPVPS